MWRNFGGGLDAVLVRPKIHMLDEMELLGAYFAEIGVSIRYSDKGNYFLDTVSASVALMQQENLLRVEGLVGS